MHRRDYILIAKVLRKAMQEAKISAFIEKARVDLIISDFCISLKEENHSFNEQKFRDYIEKGE